MTHQEMEIKIKELEKRIKTLEQESKTEKDPCEDVISRQAVIDLINADWKYENLEQPVSTLPSVNPQPKTGHCKDCKWWKDSDGVYRRGIGAESICPINREEVWKGEAYCFLYESKMQPESEEIDEDND